MWHAGQLPEPMTNEEVKELYSHWDENSWKILTERNLRLVLYAMKNLKSPLMDEDELFEVGCFGLIKAAKHFNIHKGFSFSTYAIPIIKKEIKIEMAERRKNPAIDSLEKPIDGENEKVLLKDVIAAKESVDDIIYYVDIMKVVKEELPKETERNQKIIGLILQGCTQVEVAVYMNMTKANVNRIFKAFTKRVKEGYK